MHYLPSCIANGALILHIKSSNCVFVRRVANIKRKIAGADPNMTNLSAFCAKCKYFLPKISTEIKGEYIGIAAEIEDSDRQRFSDRARPIVDFATLTSYRGSPKL